MKKILIFVLLLVTCLFTLQSSSVKAADGSPFYVNSSCNFYKNQNSIMNVNDVFKYLLTKVTSADTYSMYVESDGYTGNGDKPGIYTITFGTYFVGTIDYDPFYFDVKINVVSNLNADYIFDNSIYIYKQHVYTKEALVSDLKMITTLPDATLNCTVASDYTFGEESELGTYEYNLEYNSPSGYSGTHSGELISLGYTASDVTNTTTFNSSFAEITFIIAILGLIVFVLMLIFKKKRKKRSFY